MAFTEQQFKLQGRYANVAIGAVGALETAIIAVGVAREAVNEYLDTLQEPEERDTWRRAADSWITAERRLGEIIRALTLPS